MNPPSPPHRPFARPRKRKRHSPPTVRPNPSHYTTDLSSTSITPEAQVVALLLSETARSISLAGLPGTGKSVALRAVAHHPPVQQKFNDGVALLALSRATDMRALVAELQNVVKAIGATTDSAEYEADAIKAASKSLSNRRVLLLLDDISERTSIFVHVKRLVALVSAPGSNSTVLSSTRSLEVARMLAPRANLVVRPLKPDSELSRAILCAHAALPKDKFDAACNAPNNAIVPVLTRCGGLPMALAVAGGAIKRLLTGAPEANQKMIWAHYRAYLHDNFAQFGNISGLFRALDACAENVMWQGKGVWPVTGGVKITLSKLAAVVDSSWISYARLHSLWGVNSETELALIISGLSAQCLVSMKTLRGDLGIEVPAIVLDYCRFLSSAGASVPIPPKPRVKKVARPVQAIPLLSRTTVIGQNVAPRQVPGSQTASTTRSVTVPPGHVLLPTGGNKTVVANSTGARR